MKLHIDLNETKCITSLQTQKVCFSYFFLFTFLFCLFVNATWSAMALMNFNLKTKRNCKISVFIFYKTIKCLLNCSSWMQMIWFQFNNWIFTIVQWECVSINKSSVLKLAELCIKFHYLLSILNYYKYSICKLVKLQSIVQKLSTKAGEIYILQIINVISIYKYLYL